MWCNWRVPCAAGLLLAMAGLVLAGEGGKNERAGGAKAAGAVLEQKGYIVPVSTVQVTPEVGGRVIDLCVTEGMVVKKGAVLARLNGVRYQADYDRARALVERALARYEELKRERHPRPAQERVRVANAELDAAEAKCAKARYLLESTTIRAPIAGTILSKRVELGGLVHPLAFNVPASVCDLADLSDLEVDLSIPERDITKVFKGQACKLRAVAYPDRVYDGVVSRVLPVADRAKGAIPVRVKVRLPQKEEPGQYLRPEMSVSVAFLAKR